MHTMTEINRRLIKKSFKATEISAGIIDIRKLQYGLQAASVVLTSSGMKRVTNKHLKSDQSLYMQNDWQPLRRISVDFLGMKETVVYH